MQNLMNKRIDNTGFDLAAELLYFQPFGLQSCNWDEQTFQS